MEGKTEGGGVRVREKKNKKASLGHSNTRSGFHGEGATSGLPAASGEASEGPGRC